MAAAIVTQCPPPAGVTPMPPPGTAGSLVPIVFMARAMLSMVMRVSAASVKRMLGAKPPTTTVQTQQRFHVVASAGLAAAA
ncbi:hypothetical protein BGX38DRAFT_1266707 [Terfezia claveryi]|nr:hypothetical protein BGX38DRAFT_1266707 [Terfezia claveryi]